MVQAYILVQTEVGKAAEVAVRIASISGVTQAEDVTGPYDVIVRAEAENVDDLGRLVVAQIQAVSGITAECARTGATVVGGDVSSADTIMLAVTALGDLAGREPVTRAGARPGDLLAVAGVLGHAAAGLALLGAGLAEPAALVTAYRWPRPPYQAGPEAAALGATSMIDVSDGLVADTGHVARASGVLIDIDTARLAPGRDLLAAAARLGASRPPGPEDTAGPRDSAEPAGLVRPLVWMLTGGEDHALAATFPPATGLPAHWRVIGQVRQGEGVRVDGKPFLGQPGWDHFI